MARRGTAQGDSFKVVRDLNQEWESLRHERDEVCGWAGRHEVLEGCRDLQAVLTAVPRDPDAVLGALLREAHAGSSQAARTVLQALLGKVVLMVRADPMIGVDVYLLAMWERIRTYPVERRPRQVAANLALDTRKLARREGFGASATIPWPPGSSFADLVDRQRARECLDHGSDVAVLTAGDVIKAALELELIDAEAGALLDSVYGVGLTSAEAAGRHRTSAEMVRQRCSRALRHLAEHSHELAGYA